MPKFIFLETETDVKRLSKENFSKTVIKNLLKKEYQRIQKISG